METKHLKAGDPCPACGGELAVDLAQLPETVIDRRRRNTAKPEVAARFAEATQEKAEEFGLIHKCRTCGYVARLHPKKAKTA